MSEYARYRVQYEQRSSGQSLAALAGLASAAATGIGVIANSISEMASAFEQQVHELERGGKLSPLDCRMMALSTAPLLRAAAEAACGQPLTAAKPNLTAEALENSVQAGLKRLLVAESTLLDRAVMETLGELGYRVARRTLAAGVLQVRGDKANGTSVILCASPSQGALELDLAGFRGQGCLQERQRLLEGLRRRGVVLTQLAAQRHESMVGGALMQRIGAGGQGESRTSPGAKVGGRQ